MNVLGRALAARCSGHTMWQASKSHMPMHATIHTSIQEEHHPPTYIPFLLQQCTGRGQLFIRRKESAAARCYKLAVSSPKLKRDVIFRVPLSLSFSLSLSLWLSLPLVTIHRALPFPLSLGAATPPPSYFFSEQGAKERASFFSNHERRGCVLFFNVLLYKLPAFFCAGQTDACVVNSLQTRE